MQPRAWSNINAPAHILDWIIHGVPIVLGDKPDSFCLPNPSLNSKHCEFVNKEIARLLLSGAIEQVNFRPHCVSPIKGAVKRHAFYRSS